eukprot:544881-Prymnesium_polylepis.1
MPMARVPVSLVRVYMYCTCSLKKRTYCIHQVADDVARGGIGSLRTPCGASGTRYAAMRGLIGSRRVPST